MTPEFPSAWCRDYAPWFARPLLGVCLLVVLAGLAAGCASRNAVPVGEQRAQGLNREIMCPVCPGESIDQSQHILAVQMRGIVDEKLAEGWNDEEIRDFFVERYGASVPPGAAATGVHYPGVDRSAAGGRRGSGRAVPSPTQYEPAPAA